MSTSSDYKKIKKHFYKEGYNDNNDLDGKRFKIKNAQVNQITTGGEN
ncbi:hypothetical protein MAH1_19440 [Sessilibacter sp. MAH1]